MRCFVSVALLVASVFVPAASPSGFPGLPGKIAYSAEVFRPGQPANRQIFVFRAGGGGRRSLTKNVECYDADSPAWSRDGSLLAFDCSRYGLADEHSGIYVMRSDGSGFRRVVDGFAGHISWSPDQRRFAFTTSGAGAIYIVNISTGRKHRLTRGTYGHWVSWSPDGTKLLYDGGSPDGVYVIGVDGRGLRRLASGADPEWSPDGRRIAYLSGNWIRLMNAHGSGAQRVARAGEAPFVWSPDGRWFATWSWGNQGKIAVFRADGARANKIIAPGLSINGVTWAP